MIGEWRENDSALVGRGKSLESAVYGGRKATNAMVGEGEK